LKNAKQKLDYQEMLADKAFDTYKKDGWLENNVKFTIIPDDTEERHVPKRFFFRPYCSKPDAFKNYYVSFYYYSQAYPKRWADLTVEEKAKAEKDKKVGDYIPEYPKWPEQSEDEKGDLKLATVQWAPPMLPGRLSSLRLWSRGTISSLDGTYHEQLQAEIDLHDVPDVVDPNAKSPKDIGYGDPQKLVNKKLWEFEEFVKEQMDDHIPYWLVMRLKEKKKNKKKRRAEVPTEEEKEDPRGIRPKCLGNESLCL